MKYPKSSLVGATALLTLLALALPAQAEDVYVPPELESWAPWVLDDQENIDCPRSPNYASAVCVWPGPLALNVNATGASFEQRIDSRDEQTLVLPGNQQHWPQNVTIDNREVALIVAEGRPAVRVPAGAFTLRGRFDWASPPATLPLPKHTGLLTLTLNGQRVPNPTWRSGTLWIQDRTSESSTKVENRIDLSVYRTIEDGAPPVMRVTLNLDVAGDNREVSLGQLLPANFSPTTMRSPLPARLDSDGHLRVQARPGSWVISFSAITTPPLAQLVFNPAGDHWPEEEIWSYRSAPRLRVTEASAPSAVDPLQVGVPGPAQELPAFRMNAGDALSISERQRGFSQRAQNDLQLNRTMWLGFDRETYTVRDRLSGTLRRDWRLDVASPLTLQSASLPGGRNLLVTAAPENAALRGVEVRSPNIQLSALAEASASSTLPVSGWQTRVDGVTTSVYLPPGQRMLAATGVDTSRGDWASKWDLLDFFLMLIVAAALWRLHAPWLGALGLIALVLTIHEPGAPRWSWLAVIGALAAWRFLPAGRLRQAATVAAGLCLISFGLIAVPFVAKQLQLAVFPQLELQHSSISTHTDLKNIDYAEAEDASIQSMEMDVATVEMKRERAVAGGLASSMPRPAASPKSSYNRYASGSQVQAGPGVPQWQWRSHTLSWSGPVVPEQTFRMIILPSWVMSLWRIVAVALLLGVLSLMLKRDLARRRPTTDAGDTASAAAVLIAMASTIAATAPSLPVQAQTPSPEILQQLKTRLTRPPECVPNCTTIPRADVTYTAQSLSIALIVHATEDVALPLPGEPGGWYARNISVDGARTQTVGVLNNAAAVRLSAGVHRLVLTGEMPNASSVVLNFPLVPFHVTARGEGFEAGGLNKNSLAGGALTLIREARAQDNADAFDAMDVEQFPAFVTVERTLNFDLDWTVTTVVRRSTPPSAPISIKVPLLPGEAINTANLNVLNGVVSVNLAPGQNAVTWNSTLERTSPVVLRAAGDVPWQERWYVDTSVNWRLTHQGVPQDNQDPATMERWRPSFTPWPGEVLELNIARPDPVAGPTLAFDRAGLVRDVGRRGSESTLTLNYRATNGGQHMIKLPAGAELTSLTSDNVTLARSLDEQALALPITPGTHTLQIKWRDNRGSGLFINADPVDIGLAAANIDTQLRISQDRWVLWAHGPRIGPAVLYWSELIALILAAWVLGRFTQTPLKFHHWLLLGLGFSTFFWPAFVAVIVTLLAYRWRETQPLESRIAFNLVQVGLAFLLFVATVSLLTTIPFGLLGTADMGVTGNNSTGTFLRWFLDRTSGMLPAAGVITLPMWVYKGLILLWSLWLAFAVMRWLPWMWRAFSKDGYWRNKAPKA
ncbi:MAG: hypothetical protein AB8G16_12860 [Gammaproteobacteria bacterium]